MIKNNYLKLFSILIAVLLWVTVVVTQIEVKTINVPVVLVNPPENCIAITPIHSVSVTVKGAAKVLTNMNYSSVALNMNVNSLPLGDNLRRILPSDFTTPLGIEIVSVEPAELKLTIDQIESKYIHVAPTFIGEIAKGYKVDSIITKPDFVYVKGAQSKILNKSFISTSPVNISDLKSSTVFHIGFKEEDGVVSISPDSAEIRIKVSENIVEKEINNVPVSCMNLNSDLSLKNKLFIDSVIVKGREDLIENITSMSSFFVDCSNITKSGKYMRNISYRLMIKGVRILNINPKKIELEIE